MKQIEVVFYYLFVYTIQINMSTNTEVRINKFDLTEGLLATINIGSNSYNVSIPKEDVLKILGDDPNVNSAPIPGVGAIEGVQETVNGFMPDFSESPPVELSKEGYEILDKIKQEIIIQILSGTSLTKEQEDENVDDEVKESDNYKLLEAINSLNNEDNRGLGDFINSGGDISSVSPGPSGSRYDLPNSDFAGYEYRKYELFVGKLKALISKFKSLEDKERKTFNSVKNYSNVMLKLAIISGYVKNIDKQSKKSRMYAKDPAETLRERKKAKGEIEGIKYVFDGLLRENKNNKNIKAYLDEYNSKVVEKLSIDEKNKQMFRTDPDIKKGKEEVINTVKERINLTDEFAGLFVAKDVDGIIKLFYPDLTEVVKTEESDPNTETLDKLNTFHKDNGFKVIQENEFKKKITDEISHNELIDKLKEENNLHNLYLFFDGNFLEIPKLIQVVIKDELKSKNDFKEQIEVLANYGLFIRDGVYVNNVNNLKDGYVAIFIEFDDDYEENPIEEPIEDFKVDQEKKQFIKFEGTFAIPDSNSDSEEDIKSNRVLTNFRESVAKIRNESSDNMPLSIKLPESLTSSPGTSTKTE